jgi:membrane fusion protein
MLFRKEVFENKLARHYGEITLARPFSFWAIGCFALGVALVVLSFFVFAQYTKRATLNGRLVPIEGQVSVTLPQSGRLTEVHVKEGQSVAKGDVLFTLSQDREGRSSSHEAEVAAKLATRRMTVEMERAQQQAISSAEQVRVSERLRSVQAEKAQLEREIALQQSRLSLAEQSAAKFETLAAQGFVSKMGAQNQQELVLEQRSRVAALERGRTALERDAASLANELTAIPMRTQAALTGMVRSAATLDQEAAELNARRGFVVRAAQAGTVSGLTVHVGQVVTAGQTVASLLPTDNTLVAELYAPSRSLGFVRAGQSVWVRYAPYPYQKFGQYQGEVVEVSQAPIAARDIPAGASPVQSSEALYRVRVKLAKQSVSTYGATTPLLAGTQLEADVDLDKRRLIEWVFEPLLSLRGRVAA